METIKKTHQEKTWKSFFSNILGTTLPFILSLLPILFLKEYRYILSFFDDGQFLIFGAGLFTSSYFLYNENQISIRKKWDKFLNGFCFWALIICSASYAIIYCLKILNVQFTIDLILIRIVSIVLFLFAVFAVFRSIYLDFLKEYPEVDVKAENLKQVDNILDQLNKLQDENN